MFSDAFSTFLSKSTTDNFIFLSGMRLNFIFLFLCDILKANDEFFKLSSSAGKDSLNKSTRELKVQEIKIMKELRIKDLKALLKGYGRPISGNRKLLLQRLRDFVSDPTQWNK
ncbi:hypothetical protein BC628DRAFT_1423101 [Trametes gibbosa]|nr:hypothetical protein BC628DRAFT_1423101 [Trametes gibbosa]